MKWPPIDGKLPTRREWAQRRDYISRQEINRVRERHGVLGARETGPATPEEMELAWEAMGRPSTHEEWLEACRRTRDGTTQTE
jgi:hypothetical protein